MRQQTLNGNPGAPYAGLKDFVSRVQAFRPAFSGDAGPVNGPSDPFAALLGESLPEPGRLTGRNVFNADAIRRDFPALNQNVHGRQLVWFDNAATTQKPQAVIDALGRFYAHDNSNIHRGAHALAARATDAYERLASLAPNR